MVHNNLIDFCLHEAENKYKTVNSFGIPWVKDIKDDVICFTPNKDAVAHLLFNCYKIF